MPYVGLIFFALLAIVFANVGRIRRWWRKGCDRCRLEDIGGVGWAHTPHTCFPWRNPYKDRHGQVWEFGRKVK